MVDESCLVAAPKAEHVCPHNYFRLNKAYQFAELAKQGRTFKTDHFLIRFLPKTSGGLGFAVKATKKNFKKAHDRNYAKRRLRHLIYGTKPEVHGHMILIAHKGVIQCRYDLLQSAFLALHMILSQNPSRMR